LYKQRAAYAGPMTANEKAAVGIHTNPKESGGEKSHSNSPIKQQPKNGSGGKLDSYKSSGKGTKGDKPQGKHEKCRNCGRDRHPKVKKRLFYCPYYKHEQSNKNSSVEWVDSEMGQKWIKAHRDDPKQFPEGATKC